MKTESEIEQLLRTAPVPPSPVGLGDALKDAVSFPHKRNTREMTFSVPAWRRWIPAIAYAVMVLGCVVVLAVQTRRMDDTKQQMHQLQEQLTAAEDLKRTAELEEQKSAAAVAKLAELRQNAAEADRLAATLAELKDRIARLTAEAADLETKLAAAPKTNEIIAPFDFFNDADGPIAKARERAKAIQCVNNMKQIGLALRIWENDNEAAGGTESYPLTLDNDGIRRQLSVPKVLCCPADSGCLALLDRLKDLPDQGPNRWPLNNSTYEMFLKPGLSSLQPNAMVARCRIHGNVLYADGSVQRPDENGKVAHP